MHPVLQAVTDTLKLDVDNSMKEGKFPVDIDSTIKGGQDTGVIFASEEGRKTWDVSALHTLAKKLFNVDLPKPVTANPRKEAELQIRYTIQNIVKQVKLLAEVDVAKAFADACEQTVTLLQNKWLLIDPDGSETINEHTGEKIAATRTTGYVKGSGKTGRKKGEQAERSAALFEANKDKPTKEIVALFMSQLKMTKAGATTYCYNCRKKAGLVTVKVKKEKKAGVPTQKAVKKAAKAAKKAAKK